MGSNIKLDNGFPTQCYRPLLEGNYRRPGMADSAHSPELSGPRDLRAAQNLFLAHWTLPQAFRFRTSQVPSPPPALMSTNLRRGPPGVQVESGLCRGYGKRELGLQLES